MLFFKKKKSFERKGLWKNKGRRTNLSAYYTQPCVDVTSINQDKNLKK